MTMGCLMLDLQGTELSAEEQELLAHPKVGGLICFTRNYESVDQITELTKAVRTAAARPLLIAVDMKVVGYSVFGSSLPAYRRWLSWVNTMITIRWQHCSRHANWVGSWRQSYVR